jgi:hypothetical protein
MGVAIRGALDQLQGQTDGLVDWITKVRVKKNSIKRLRRKNLRVQAVLTNTLVKAETLLRMKQQQRYQRWQRLKVELSKANRNSVCSATSDNQPIQWDEKICEDIDSLNSFMCLLNEVKSPLQR